MSDPNRIVLITGASRGLGYATALALAGPGTQIVAVARTVGGLEELDDAITQKGGSTTLVPLDITNDAGLTAMASAIQGRWGRLDLFVHAAAHAVPRSPVGHVAEKDLDRAWAVNARALQRLISAVEPLLNAGQNTGRAIIVDDQCNADGFLSAYAASKDAARRMSQSWAQESKRIGPNVTLFAPQPMPTALRARFSPGEDRATLSPCTDEAARLIATI